MEATSYCAVWNCDASLTGTGALSVQNNGALLSAESFCYAEASLGYGNVSLPALQGFGSSGGDFGLSPIQNLPALTATAYADQYTPPVATTGYGNLPPLVAASRGISIKIGTATLSMPALTSIGMDGEYGVARTQMLPALRSLGVYGIPGEAYFTSATIAITGMGTERDIVVVLTSEGTVADVYTISRLVSDNVISTAVAEGSMSVLGIFSIEFLQTIYGNDFQSSFNTSTEAGAIDSSSQVWVVNLDTGATSQYDNYGFLDFFEEDGAYYGIAEDGIYQLDGDNDNGINIDSLIDFGKMDFGTRQRKRVTAMFVAATSDDNVIVKVEADGDEYFYIADSNDAEVLKAHRVRVGMGLAAGFLNFKLTNRNGCDIDFDTLEFEPVVLPGRM